MVFSNVAHGLCKQIICTSRLWYYRSRTSHNWLVQYQTMLDISVVKDQS